MTDRDFVYWLQGFFEVQNPYSIDSEKTKMIKDHLNLVFNHVLEEVLDKVRGIPGYQLIEDENGLGVLYKGKKYYSNDTTEWKNYDPKSGYSC